VNILYKQLPILLSIVKSCLFKVWF